MYEEYDVIDILRKKLEEIEGQARRLRAAIEVLCDNGIAIPPSVPQTNGGVTSPISDICRYLAGHSGPVSQNDLIHAVGDIRRRRYPALSNHYNNVWRALEYHIRHGKAIECVDQEGAPADLKPLPPRSKGKKLPDSPELYEQNNWFVLKNQEERPERVPKGLTLFKQE